MVPAKSSPASSDAEDFPTKPWNNVSSSAPELSTVEHVTWFVTLIAAAESYSTLDLPSVDGGAIHPSLHGVDLSSTFLNVSGSFLEGFFVAWDEEGWLSPFPALAPGGLSEKPGDCRGDDKRREGEGGTSVVATLLRALAGVVRDSFLATYMSWVQLVEHGGQLARHGGIRVGAVYVVATVILALVAHTAGTAVALAVDGTVVRSRTRRVDGRTAALSGSDAAAAATRRALFAVLLSYVSYAFLRCQHDTDFSPKDVTTEIEFPNEYIQALVTLPEGNASRLFMSVAFSVVGAHLGNCIGENVVANTLFAALTLVAHVLFLSRDPELWTRSHILGAFIGSFCGSGSSFGGMCTGAMEGSMRQWGSGPRRKRVWASAGGLALHMVVALLFVNAFNRYGYYAP